MVSSFSSLQREQGDGGIWRPMNAVRNDMAHVCVSAWGREAWQGGLRAQRVLRNQNGKDRSQEGFPDLTVRNPLQSICFQRNPNGTYSETERPTWKQTNLKKKQETKEVVRMRKKIMMQWTEMTKSMNHLKRKKKQHPPKPDSREDSTKDLRVRTSVLNRKVHLSKQG